MSVTMTDDLVVEQNRPGLAALEERPASGGSGSDIV
jgi:hypothetical protein